MNVVLEISGIILGSIIIIRAILNNDLYGALMGIVPILASIIFYIRDNLDDIFPDLKRDNNKKSK